MLINKGIVLNRLSWGAAWLLVCVMWCGFVIAGDLFIDWVVWAVGGQFPSVVLLTFA